MIRTSLSFSRGNFALLGCAFVVAAAGCSKSSSDAARPDTTAARPDTGSAARDVVLTAAQAARVKVATVDVSAFRPVVNTTGTVAFNGDHSTQVLAPVSGPITRIMVNPGSVVRKGDPLATVTSPDFATAVAAYRKANAAFVNSKRIAEQDSLLFKNDAISRREVEQAQTDASSALADRDAAIEQMRALGVDDATIESVRTGRSAAAPEAVIRAPLDGTVVEKLVNPGQLIQAGTTQCFTVADLSTVWVMANVFESDLGAVAAGERAMVSTTALPQPIAANVEYVGSLVDPASKATGVRVLAPNPRGILKKDMLVNVAISSSQARNGILVPTSAVLRDDENLPYVYVSLPNNHYARRSITLGTRNGDSYEVKAGLAAGEHMVVDGSLFLQFAGSQ